MQINKEVECEVIKKKMTNCQEKWFSHFNAKGEKMVSTVDMLNIESKEKKLIESIREDFENDYVMSSTQVDYVNNTVTHDANSTVVKHTVIKLKEIPVCDPTYIKDLVASKPGLEYLRALCNDMKLSAEQIIKKFEDLSGKSAEEIRFWTLNADERKRQPIGAVELFFYYGRFYCNAWRHPDDGFDCYVSRGVRQSVPIAKQQEALP